MRQLFGLGISFGLYLLGMLMQQQAHAGEPVVWKKFNTAAGTISDTVVVVDDVALLHTGQIFPLHASGKVLGETAAEQLIIAANGLEVVMSAVKGVSFWDRESVKLNIYVDSIEAAQEVTNVLRSKSNAEKWPAISLVVTPLPVSGVHVAMDGIVALPRDKSPENVLRKHVDSIPGNERFAHIAVLPRGDVIYVSGQAEPGDSIHAASLATFKGLLRTMDHLKLPYENIVQFKVFLDPMEKAPEVEKALAELMPEGLLPPLVFVQWESPGTVEIEMIAAAPKAEKEAAGESISFLTPPWMEASPNFCRVTRVHGAKRVYFPSLTALKPGDGAAQVRSVYEQLGSLAQMVGTDYEHLAKATYYVSDNDASTQLNKLRPNYYNPKRPPAASKASVKHVGVAERSFNMDMIGVVP